MSKVLVELLTTFSSRRKPKHACRQQYYSKNINHVDNRYQPTRTRKSTMARTTTTKKTKPKPAKPKQNMQTAMPKGKYGKFEVVYKNTLSLHANKKPVDKTPTEEKMTQSMGRCAAAYTCLADNMPLSTKH